MKTNYVVILSLLWFHVTAPKAAYGTTGRSAGAERIFGGEETSPHEFPYQLLMKEDGALHCAGLVLDKDWAVSAGHCAGTDDTSSRFTFHAGKHDTTVPESTEQEVTVVEILKNENFYSKPRLTYDIALYRVKPPFELNEYVQKVALPKRNGGQYSTGTAVAIGWGNTENGYSSPKLRKVSLPLMTNERCQELLGSDANGAITPVHLCAGADSGKSACYGDSGGPLLFMEDGRQVMVGLVSWGIYCGDSDSPTVFTRVTEFIDWMESKTGIDLSGSGNRNTSVSRSSGGPGIENVGVKISNGLAQTMCKGFDDYQKEKKLALAFKVKPKTPEKCGWAKWSKCQDGGTCKPFNLVTCKA